MNDRRRRAGHQRTRWTRARAAFDVLRAVTERDAYADLALPPLLTRRGIVGRDAAFATRLTYGACRTRGLLDAVIAAAATARGAHRPVLLDLLRLGTYQLLRTRVEPHAAVSTASSRRVSNSIRRGRFRQRRAAHHRRARDEAAWVAELAPPAAGDPVGRLAFAHAHPRWIAQAFADALGARR